MIVAMAIRLSPLDVRDVAAVQALHIRSFSTLARGSYGAEQIDAYARTLAAPEYRDELLACELRVLFDEVGEPVATAGWSPQPDQPDKARIRVEPAVRGQDYHH
jgi:hypothetical protein